MRCYIGLVIWLRLPSYPNHQQTLGNRNGVSGKSCFAEQQARDLLAPHVPIIMALSIVLKIRRTLTGAEIDDVIATTVAGLQLAEEQARRREWRNAELAAERFRAECNHTNVAALATF
jgi:hypothetical protein